MNHAILVSIGTDGDVWPFLHLGSELKQRGFRVTLATHEHFAERAARAGLEFLCLVTQPETEHLLGRPDFWHPLRGPLVVGRWGARLFRKQYEALKAAASGKDAFFVATPGMLAARILQEEIKAPLVSILLQPWLIPSVEAPAVMMGGLTLPRWAPRPVGRLYYRLFHVIGLWIVGSDVTRLRASLGLPPFRQMFQWWLSPQLALGLFPAWFGPPQRDWPPQIQLLDFPLPHRQTRPLPRELAEFCRNAKQVIAFTFGTGMMHARRLFHEAIEACHALRAQGIFLTPFRSQIPEPLPDFVRHCEFAPFEDLFPLCSAVVHHGGIGTVAETLAAGTPQLILPFAFDQLDNALRVKRLQAGAFLGPRHRNHLAVAHALARLVNPESVARARAVAARLSARNGLRAAADSIEDFCEPIGPSFYSGKA